MKKKIIAWAVAVAAVLGIYASVQAATPGIPITVPSAASAGYMLTSTAGGTYQASSTEGLTIGSLNATSTKSSTFMGKLSVASSTPWGLLSVNPSGVSGPEFVVGSSTQTDFMVGNDGKLTIGPGFDTKLYRSASGKLNIQNTTAGSPSCLKFENSGNSVAQICRVNGTNQIVGGDQAGDLLLNGNRIGFQTGYYGNLLITSSNLVGVSGNTGGTTTPWGKFVIEPTAGEAANEFVIGSSTKTDFLVDNGGKVAIGKTAASAGFLDIDSKTSSVSSVTINRNDASQTFLKLTDNGTTQFAIDHSANSSVSFQGSYGVGWITGNNGNFTIIPNGTGNVGIATTSPTYPLSVQGSALISGDISLANLIATGTETVSGVITSNGGFTYNFGSAVYQVVGSGSTIKIGTNTAHNIGLQTGGTVRLTIDTSGFAGLGSTTPSQLLSVQGNTLISGDITSVANITATGTLTISGQAITGTVGKITLSGGGHLNAGALETGNINSSDNVKTAITIANTTGNVNFPAGSVALGSTTAAQLLSVQGNTIISGNLTSVASITATGTLTLSALSNGCLNISSGAVGSTGSSCNTGTVTSIATNNGLTGGTITTTGTLGLDLTKEVSNTLQIWNGSQLQATGTPALTAGYIIATTTAASQLPYASSTSATISGTPYITTHKGFSYATTTPWTATTTIFLEVAYGETWNSGRCSTDAGTLNIDFYHASSHLNLLNASTTMGTFTFSTNNAMTTGDLVKVDIGTPASSPLKVVCTLNMNTQ